MNLSEYQSGLVDIELYTIVEDLNYTNIICYFDRPDYKHVKRLLMRDNCNHLYRLERVKLNQLFYIENCDLQDIYDEKELIELITYENFVVLRLNITENGYILTNDVMGVEL